MKGITRIFPVLLMLIVAVSCRDRPSVLPLSDSVSSALNDTSSTGYHVVRGYSHSVAGSIAVLGDAVDVMPIVEDLISNDRFDNIDARAVPDGLTDFAGEHIAAYVLDSLSTFSECYAGGGPDTLVELSVREFIASLDTSCLSGYIGNMNEERKPRAKIVVLASSFSSACGFRDIDTLCTLAGLDVPVLSATDEMLRYALGRFPQPAKVCLWTTENRVDCIPYGRIYKRIGGIADELRIITPVGEDPWDQLISFLQNYVSDGSLRQISAIAVDDPDVDPAALRAACDSLAASIDPELSHYRTLLSRDFELVFPADAVARCCYALLREGNTFTHRVAEPEIETYSLTDSTVVRLRSALLTDELMCLMENKAPKVLSRYVCP